MSVEQKEKQETKNKKKEARGGKGGNVAKNTFFKHILYAHFYTQ